MSILREKERAKYMKKKTGSSYHNIIARRIDIVFEKHTNYIIFSVLCSQSLKFHLMPFIFIDNIVKLYQCLFLVRYSTQQ